MSTEGNLKKRWTDEERFKLAEKLDRELDEFVAALEKRPRDGDVPPRESWEDEIERHPFFMKEAPEPGSEQHPLYEGLQQLKYDPDENTPEELASSYKEDGNFYFKHEKYRAAIIAYTEGIKLKCGDVELQASLFNNRSAAHYFLKNYRSGLRDCESALKLKPDYEKALMRAAFCCYELRRYEKCQSYCDQMLTDRMTNKTVLELRNKAAKAAKLASRNERMKQRKDKRVRNVQSVLLRTILERTGKKCAYDDLEPVIPQLQGHRVHLNEENRLVWPVVFLYPEHEVMDFLQEFSEDDTFPDRLRDVFKQAPEWDRERKYRPENLNVYFKDRDMKIVAVRAQETLADVLKKKEFCLNRGVASFFIVVRGTKAEEILKK